MTADEIAVDITDQAQELEGYEYYDILTSIEREYQRLHRDLRIPDALETTLQTPDTFTWATADGITKEIGSELTRWTGRPQRITDSAANVPWVLLPLLQVQDRITYSPSQLRFAGGRVFAQTGDAFTLVSAPDSDITVSVTHYQQPAELSGSSTPSLPTQHQRILVEAGVRDAYRFMYARETNPTLKRGFLSMANEWEDRRDATERKLISHINKQEMEQPTFRPPPLWESGNISMGRRRRFRTRR